MRVADLMSIPAVLITVTLIGCAGGGIYALHLGQDINYDQMAYHYDSAYEFLYNRMAFDAAPEGLIHAFFNPLPYVPFYLMERSLPPRAVIFLLGAWQGINLGLVLLIAVLTTRAYVRWLRIVLCAGALLVSLASPMALSEVGSTMSDITTSIFVLSGLALLIADTAPRRDRSGWLLTGLGSCLIGIAIGLKLTNMIYAPGVVACCALGWRSWGPRARALLLAGTGGAFGVLLAGGPWFLRLWSMFRSPVFPYYDAIFRSPEIDSQSWLHGTSFFDGRFLPLSVVDAVLLPFRWLTTGTSTTEFGFRDIRFALIACILASALVFAVVASVGLGRKQRPPLLSATQRKLLAFFTVRFACWMTQFSIQRYLLGLELLAGPVIIVALGCMLRGRILATATTGTAFLALVTVQPPSWGRIKPLTSWYDVKLPPALEQPGLAFLQGPISFVAPFLPAESRVIGLGGGPVLRAGSGIFPDRAVRASLNANAALPVFVISDEPISADTRQVLTGYRLRLTGPCWPIPNRGNKLSACELSRMSVPESSTAVLPARKVIDFGESFQGIPFLLQGWHMDTSWGGVGAKLAPSLELRLDPALGPGPVRLRFHIAGMGAIQPEAAITLKANGHTAAIWHPIQPTLDGPFIACIPAVAIDEDRVVVLQFRYAMQKTANSTNQGKTLSDIGLGLQSMIAEPAAACTAEATLD
jgi:hypothetical protein